MNIQKRKELKKRFKEKYNSNVKNLEDEKRLIQQQADNKIKKIDEKIDEEKLKSEAITKLK